MAPDSTYELVDRMRAVAMEEADPVRRRTAVALLAERFGFDVSEIVTDAELARAREELGLADDELPIWLAPDAASSISWRTIELDPAYEPDRSLMEDGPTLAPVDEDGRRVDAPLAPFSIEHAAALRSIREDHAEPVGLDRFEIRTPRFRDHAEEIGHARALELLRIVSKPIPERDGWRRTADGREWYSAAWLGIVA